MTYGDYKPVAGRMVNHSFEWINDGKASKSTMTNISFDTPDAGLFAMPR